MNIEKSRSGSWSILFCKNSVERIKNRADNLSYNLLYVFLC